MNSLKIKLINIYYYLISFFQYFLFIAYKKTKTISNQKKNIFAIPIIIINYNQLYYLKKLLNFLISRGYKNIIIIDNNSNYKPLLDFYKTLDKSIITIDYQSENLGHLVFFKKKELIKKYAKTGYYILTDSDIVPNEKLNNDFVLDLIKTMEKYHFNICKVGFALRIDDLPQHYPLKEKVIKWEKQFWTKKVNKTDNIYYAEIDTTFALYKPFYKRTKFQNFFNKGIRIGGNFTCMHGGWYIDPNNMTDEQINYFRTSNSSSSWIFDKKGNLLEKESNRQYD